MLKKYRLPLLVILGVGVLAAVLLACVVLPGSTVAILQPRGTIAAQERGLIGVASLLAVLVIVPVFVMTAVISWRYRAGNTKATYTPDADRNRVAETVWWLIPFTIIFILSVITWNTSHSLDPFRPLASTKKPLQVQVVALQWRWLFIYPEQRIASVNLIQFPVGTPVEFHITSDAPMNSFWIPQLGGQIYAMSGMSTQLHLSADQAGDYRGVSANLSGAGFADMRFTARASSQEDFDEWVRFAQSQPTRLTLAAYNELAMPSRESTVAYYSAPAANLYDTILKKYMGPETTPMHAQTEGS